jgi:hypothetical protein
MWIQEPQVWSQYTHGPEYKPATPNQTSQLIWEASALRGGFDTTTATKADDAETSHHLWDTRIWNRYSSAHDRQEEFQRVRGHCPLTTIQAVALTVWCKRVLQSLLRFLRLRHGSDWGQMQCIHPDITAGRDCICKVAGSEWWDWVAGSTMFFCRWPEYGQQGVRDSLRLWWQEPPPKYTHPQPIDPSEGIRNQFKSKLLKIMAKGYIQRCSVQSLTLCFTVPKGDADIYIKYDASRSDLHDSIWVQSFTLPHADALTNLLEPMSWMGDIDMGEHFLNFPVDKAVCPYCGINVHPYLNPGSKQTMWLGWS